MTTQSPNPKAIFATLLLVASALAACGSTDAGTEGTAGGGSSSSGSTKCSKAHTQDENCSSNSDCYSDNCFEGLCYIGKAGCASDADCTGYAPNASYTATCSTGTLDNGCAIYCE